ncbi:MAG TPA: hypothetical protein VGP07_26670 [Polyangia bacterium]|jgi:hypothetical protein
MARIVAMVADGIQLALLPLVMGGVASPIDDVIDVVTAAVLTGLVGFHWASLPAFVAELVPFVDLVPSWTIAVFISTRDRDHNQAVAPDGRSAGRRSALSSK